MKEGMGFTVTINIMLIFIAIVFAFLAATLSYYKAFKVNNYIVNSLEKFEGYNDLSKQEIEQTLMTLGYEKGSINCPDEKNGGQLTELNAQNLFKYCIYYHDEDDKHYSYGVMTYIKVELPLFSMFRLPIYTKTNLIYDLEGLLGGGI